LHTTVAADSFDESSVIDDGLFGVGFSPQSKSIVESRGLSDVTGDYRGICRTRVSP
jgi:hypothetical protein